MLDSAFRAGAARYDRPKFRGWAGVGLGWAWVGRGGPRVGWWVSAGTLVKKKRKKVHLS